MCPASKRSPGGAEPFLTPELFAQTFCDDVGLVSHSYRDQVASSIRAQIDELTGVAEIPLLTPEQEAENVEMDLRVVINVCRPPAFSLRFSVLSEMVRLMSRSKHCI